MIVGLGTDIVKVARIAKSIETIQFKERVFSKHEIAYCESKKNKAESYAARFAAKEAFFKALGTGLREGLAFNEVEVRNDELGKPGLFLTGNTADTASSRNIKVMHVSLSHTDEMAVATIVLED